MVVYEGSEMEKRLAWSSAYVIATKFSSIIIVSDFDSLLLLVVWFVFNYFQWEPLNFNEYFRSCSFSAIKKTICLTCEMWKPELTTHHPIEVITYNGKYRYFPIIFFFIDSTVIFIDFLCCLFLFSLQRTLKSGTFALFLLPRKCRCDRWDELNKIAGQHTLNLNRPYISSPLTFLQECHWLQLENIRKLQCNEQHMFSMLPGFARNVGAP